MTLELTRSHPYSQNNRKSDKPKPSIQVETATEYHPQSLYIGEICYNCTITCAKLSILAFYRRIFATRGFRISSYFVDALCIAWFLILTFITIFQCKPIEAGFNVALALTAKCVPYAAFNFGLEFTNATLDIVILCLPINMIRRLHMPVRQRIVLSGIFLLGGLYVCSQSFPKRRNPLLLMAIASSLQAFSVWR